MWSTCDWQILVELEFSRQIFEKNTPISNFVKIHPVGAELFHADGRTGMTKLVVAFGNFVNAPQSRHAVSRGRPEWRKTVGYQGSQGTVGLQEKEEEKKKKCVGPTQPPPRIWSQYKKYGCTYFRPIVGPYYASHDRDIENLLEDAWLTVWLHSTKGSDACW